MPVDGSDDADAGSGVVRRRGVVVGRRPRAATLPQPEGDDAAASDAAAPSQAAAAPPLLPPPPRGLSLPHPHSAQMPQPPPPPPGRPPPLPARSTVVPGPVINPNLLPMRTASMPKDSPPQPPPPPRPAHPHPPPPPVPSRSSTTSAAAAAAAAAEPGSSVPVRRALQSYSSVPALPRSAARRRTSDAEQPTASDAGSFPLLGSGPNTMARITEEPASSAHAALPTTMMDSKLQAPRTQRPQAPQRLGSGSSTVVVEAAAAAPVGDSTPPAGPKAAYPSRGDSIGQNKYAFREVLASTASAESASSNPSLEAPAVHSAPAPVSRRSTTLPRRVAT
ncbi:hypothetical protein HK405_000560, partial [Cladochytrium tenue]